MNVRQGAFDSPAQKLAPQGIALVVVHNQSVHYQLAGNAKGVELAFYLPGIHDARKAEGSPSDRSGHSAHRVVHNFVTAKQV